MVTLLLRFPGGRYHATPWGHHVNEGLVEWPPSPWRVLRALVACGFSTQHWQHVPPVAAQLLEKLAGTMPSYALPRASAAHTRHYMPIGSIKKGRESTTLVFDTWVDMGAEPLAIRWDCDLTEDECCELDRLARCLGYLGRSESWVEGESVADGTVPTERFNTYPHQDGMRMGPGWEQISLLAAVPPGEYAAWRHEAVQKVLDRLPLPPGKRKPPAKLVREREREIAPYPASLLDCLMKDTVWWKDHRWSQPPGGQQVLYWRPQGSVEVAPPPVPSAAVVSPVTMVLLALTTPSGNRSALPSCNRTLPQAELLHSALVGRVGMGKLVDCPEITGRDENGRPLRRRHGHAHILPLDLDGDGHIDHVVVHAPMGLGAEAQLAISTLRRTWNKGGVGDLQLAVAGSGELDSLRALPAPLDARIRQLLGPVAGARTWVSATPFVAPRFLKQSGGNALAGQVQAELASRGFPDLIDVEVLPATALAIASRHFVRCRTRGGMPPPIDAGFALRLRLAEPVAGPLTLGYAAHFGLGLFFAEA